VLGQTGVESFPIKKTARFSVVAKLIPGQLLEEASSFCLCWGNLKESNYTVTTKKDGPEFIGAIFINIMENALAENSRAFLLQR